MMSNELAAGAVFGRYSIVRKIGEGGMGAVYEARHLDLDKRVALKTLASALSLRGEAQARFLREARVAARLDHPHAVAVSDVGTCDGLPYMVMEFLEGEDFQALLEREGKLTAQGIADIILPVLLALQAAHEVGIVHRDVKPHNIFLVRTRHGGSHPKLLDFGISKIVDGIAGGDLTHTASMLGTPYYMSPEHVQSSKHADARSDQYSLAVLMYQAASGTLPYQAADLYPLLSAISSGNHVPLQQREPSLPPEFCAIVERGMSLSRDQRYPTLQEMGQDLLRFCSPAQQSKWQEAFTPVSLDKARAVIPISAETPKPFERSVAATSNSLLLPLNKPAKPWLLAVAGGGVAVVSVALLMGHLLRPKSDAAAASATPSAAPDSADPSPPTPVLAEPLISAVAAEAPPAQAAPPASSAPVAVRAAAAAAVHAPTPKSAVQARAEPPKATGVPAAAPKPAVAKPPVRSANDAPFIE
jgi:serine/threonine-protein kinase